MDKVFSVSEFLGEINSLLAFPVCVEGEVSSFRVNQGKWVFFDLKDEQAEALVNCFAVVWKIKAPLEDGMRVRVYGSPKIFEKSGKFSITVERVEPVGEGALRRAYELLKRKLAGEGLFAPERKRPLPRFPETVGMVASRDSAAYGDFIRIMGNRWSGAKVLLYDSPVQGEGAAEKLAEGVRYFSSPSAPWVDALVIIRGGGSLEDLAAFNSEELARAIYASRVPTVVGVGHERDESIADYVADLRASTPSNAAELVFPDRRELLLQIDHLAARASAAADSGVSDCRHRVGSLTEAVIRIAERSAERGRRIVGEVNAAFRQFTARLIHYGKALDLLGRTAANLNPERLLERGYAIVRSGGKIVKSAASLAPGEAISVRLHKGSVGAEVTSLE